MLGGSSPFFIVHLDARSFFFLLFLPFLRTSSAPFLLLNFLVFLAFPRIRSGLPSTRIDTRQFLRSRLESKFPRVSPRSHVQNIRTCVLILKAPRSALTRQTWRYGRYEVRTTIRTVMENANAGKLRVLFLKHLEPWDIYIFIFIYVVNINDINFY